MDEVVQQFVERMGLLMENDGLPRIAGRIHGLLLVSDTAFSLDELSEKLQVSKASVSTNARMLERMGIVERISTPGDRRDFYQMSDDAWERLIQVLKRRWRNMQAVFAEYEALLPSGMETGKRRLREAELFHTMLLEDVDCLIEQWRARRSEANQPAEERSA
jgi:DNA-binding transcriptional regulator GbsR (MarR family)